MANLVLGGHQDGRLSPATLRVLAAARAIGGESDLLIVGNEITPPIAEALTLPGVRHVLSADDETFRHPLAEDVAPLLVSLAPGYSHILADASADGKSLLPRVAALLDVDAVTGVSGVIDASTFKRPVYAGNGIAVVQSQAAVKVLTVMSSAFTPVAREGGLASHQPLSGPFHRTERTRWLSERSASPEGRPELTTASVVIAGGRGMKSGENFSLLYQLADKLGAAVGASRAAVDAGFVANELQVGQTGKVVAPVLYIAVGISGAIQHLAGMRDSGTIVAINNDPDAPIFAVADYALEADLFDALPELIRLLS
ncbi:electron transfer flavoprotein subunit alpha/FixB family protein [Erwinia sp. E602]|uniref:electron transfer flavoprotein subunit alpha/FixB family protein n=1 Tax=Erwinia sp. E602 TaxID=2675378 RepID=UPI001BADD2CA|nr:FAD-binding protein [Erwinia sp. E602]QUG76971.1 electron transfer flavoprotein subunit alpha/FixB family protein [Erwinia sp. E602]